MPTRAPKIRHEQDQAHLRWLDNTAQVLPTYPQFIASDIIALIRQDPNAVLPDGLNTTRLTPSSLSRAWSRMDQGRYTISKQAPTSTRKATLWSVSPPDQGTDEKLLADKLARAQQRAIREEHRLARKWARQQGIAVNLRGQVNKQVMATYQRAKKFESQELERSMHDRPEQRTATPTNHKKASTMQPAHSSQPVPTYPRKLDLTPLVFSEATTMVTPRIARSLLVRATKVPDQDQVKAHTEAMEQTVEGTYSPLDCLILLDPMGRPLTGIALLEACARTDMPARMLVVSTAEPQPQKEAEASSATTGLPGNTPGALTVAAAMDPDDPEAIEHAARVLQAIDAAAGALGGIIVIAHAEKASVSQGLRERARALLDHTALGGEQCEMVAAGFLDPVFVDALRLLLAEQVGAVEAGVIDGPYAMLFQALDHGLATEPTLTSMLNALAGTGGDKEQAAELVVSAWHTLWSADYLATAHRILEHTSIIVSPEVLASLIHMRELDFSTQEISGALGYLSSTVTNWLNVVDSVMEDID